LDIKQLKYFLEVCKTNNFSEAARQLYITEQGLNKAIKNLESELQFHLFYRDGGKMKLTNYGIYLKQKSRHLIDEFDLLKYSMNELSINNSSKIKIGYSLGIISMLFCECIFKFKKDYPDIELNITEYQDFFCEQAVYDGKIDLGVAISPVDKSKFDFQTIISRKLCLIINNENRLSNNKQINFIDIKNEKIAIVNENFKIYHNFIDICKKAEFKPNICFATSDINQLAYLIKINKFVSIGPYFTGIPQLNFIPFKHKNCIFEVCLITKKGFNLSPNVQIFINYILNSFKKC
jgi:DNA-binding transcriptional LysR family regulator